MHSQGRLPEACAAFEEMIQLGRAMGHTWALLAGQTYLAQVWQTQGQLHQARALLKEALSEASQQGARSRGYVAFVEANLASVQISMADVGEAWQNGHAEHLVLD